MFVYYALYHFCIINLKINDNIIIIIIIIIMYYYLLALAASLARFVAVHLGSGREAAGAHFVLFSFRIFLVVFVHAIFMLVWFFLCIFYLCEAVGACAAHHDAACVHLCRRRACGKQGIVGCFAGLASTIPLENARRHSVADLRVDVVSIIIHA